MWTASQILKGISDGKLSITPWNIDNLNPNSYNVSIGSEIVMYTDSVLDFKVAPKTKVIQIPESGLILHPGRVYLAKTLEYTEINGVVSVLYGRSSAARLGLFVHASAGLGDTGYKGHWTLSLIATQPVKIYPGQSLAQLVFMEPNGSTIDYSGKYQNNTGVGVFKPET